VCVCVCVCVCVSRIFPPHSQVAESFDFLAQTVPQQGSAIAEGPHRQSNQR
jgi:hypothetical protein